MQKLKLFFCFALAVSLGQVPQAHAIDIYSTIWQPATSATLKRDVQLYRNNGLAMDMLMERALMYKEGKAFLDEVKNALDKNPKNSTLLASYARALIVLKGTYLWNGKDAPQRLGERHSLNTNSIAALIQTAKENSAKPWLAYVAEEELSIYRGTGSANSFYGARLKMARKSVAIERNPLTLTKLASKMVSAEAMENQPKGATQQGVALLERIVKAYPTYSRAKIFLWQSYTYYPLAKNATKSQQAYRDLLSIIPQDRRDSPPVQRYLKWQHFDQRD